MGRKIALREDFDGSGLRRIAKASKDAGQSRRLLVLAEIYDGCRIGNVGLRVIRDWVLRFNAEGADGLIDKKPPGGRSEEHALRPPRINARVRPIYSAPSVRPEASAQR